MEKTTNEELLTELETYKAKVYLHTDRTRSYSEFAKKNTWWCNIELEQDGVKLEHGVFRPTPLEALTVAYDAVMGVARRGMNLRALAAPPVEGNVEIDKPIGSDIPF